MFASVELVSIDFKRNRETNVRRRKGKKINMMTNEEEKQDPIYESSLIPITL